jgi:tetratricopeptide (TPR) repeat protein
MNTTAASILGGCILAAAIIFVTAKGDAPTAPAVVPDGDSHATTTEGGSSAAPDLMGASVETRLAKLERELRDARAEIARRDRMATTSPVPEAGEEATAGTEEKQQALFFALGKAYANGTATKEQVGELMRLAKDKDLMTRVVTRLNAQIAEDPDDVEARMQLVEVQSARLHSADSITERSLIRGTVKEQLQAVLERDENNWDARYMQAVGISHSQRSPQGRANAIKAFESLIAIQDGQARQPRFAKPYAELAGVLLQEKDTARARETIRAGLTQYPDDEDLKALLAKLDAAGN